MLRILFCAVLCSSIHADVIYEMSNSPVSQVDPFDGSQWTVDGTITVSDFGLITESDIVGWHVELSNGVELITLSDDDGFVVVPHGLTADSERLWFSHDTSVANGGGNLDWFILSDNTLLDGELTGNFDTLQWSVNDAQPTVGYWSKFGNGLNDFRWSHVQHFDSATIGMNPVMTSEPKQVVTILMACLGILLTRKLL